MIEKIKKTNNALSNLEYFSFLYFALPLILFYFNWFKPVYSFPIILLNFWLFYTYRLEKFHFEITHLKHLIFSLFILISLGYGEFLPQSADWNKHNAIFTELFNNPFKPSLIAYNHKQYLLCYGLGFYITPSFVANLFNNYQLIAIVYLSYSSIGLCLIGWYIQRIFNIQFYAILLLFWIGRLTWILYLRWQVSDWLEFGQIFHLIGNVQLLSIIRDIPQHGIPIILSFLILYNALQTKNPNFIFLFSLITFGFFWTPFILFALIPFIFFIPLKQLFLSISANKIISSIALLNLLILFIYYSQHLPTDLVNFEKYTVKLFIFKFFIVNALNYFIFFALFIYCYKMKIIIQYFELKVLFILFCFYSLYNEIHYGFFNDFADKSTLLLPFFINVLLIKVLINWDLIKSHTIKYLFISIVLLSMIMPLKISILQALSMNNINLGIANYNLKKQNISSLDDALNETNTQSNYPFTKQYIGNKSAFFEIVLKK